MASIVEIEFEIEGMAPLMMDKWLDGKPPKTPEEYQKQAYLKVYTNEKGEIGIPADALKAAIREASTACGKRMQGKERRDLVRSCVFIEPEVLLIGKEKPDVIDGRPVQRQQGKKITTVVSYRPLFKDWSCKGTIKLVTDNLTEGDVKNFMEHAGFFKGLLSHRPEFGRFTVTKWKVKK